MLPSRRAELSRSFARTLVGRFAGDSGSTRISELPGLYRTGARGSGIEVDSVRPYEDGDDPRSVDWSVTGRTGVYHVRQYREERARPLVFLVDRSASMFASRSEDPLDTPPVLARVADLAALWSFAALQNRDPVGAIGFGRGPALVQRPTRREAEVHGLLRSIEAPTSAGGSSTDLRDAVGTAERVLRSASIVVLLSDFESPGQDLRALLVQLARRHTCVALRFASTEDRSLLRSGLRVFRDPETGASRAVDTLDHSVRRAYELARARHLAELDDRFAGSGVPRLDLHPHDSVVKSLLAWFGGHSTRGSGR